MERGNNGIKKQEIMVINSIKIRWIYATCYEIALPNNKVILIDPYISPMKFSNFKLYDITLQCDDKS